MKKLMFKLVVLLLLLVGTISVSQQTAKADCSSQILACYDLRDYCNSEGSGEAYCQNIFLWCFDGVLSMCHN